MQLLVKTKDWKMKKWIKSRVTLTNGFGKTVVSINKPYLVVEELPEFYIIKNDFRKLDMIAKYYFDERKDNENL